MSSSEQAPEPTMDEILASIRKIIADDDESSAAAPAASPDTAPQEAGHGALSDEIAGAMGAQDAPGEVEDDIFDLTDQVREPAPQPSPAGFAPAPPAEPAQPNYAAPSPQQPAPDPFAASAVEHPVPPVTGAAALPPEPSFAEEFSGEAQGMPPAAGGVLAGAPMEESALPESATGFGAAEAEAPVRDASWETPGDTHMADSMGATDFPRDKEVADLDSFSPGQNIDAPADRVEEAFAESDVVAATGAPQSPDFAQPAAPAETAFATAPEREEAVPAPAAEAPDPVIVPAAPEPALMEEAETAEEPETEAPVAAADAGRKSLEDSVKEMLRPMLRAWLDDNMPRIVESAVRDELQNKHNQF